jgi:glucose dehydrogenase
MKKLLIAGLCAWCVLSVQSHAQTADELINAGKNADNVPVQGMGCHLRNYSPLNQINPSNVKRLVPVWAISL